MRSRVLCLVETARSLWIGKFSHCSLFCFLWNFIWAFLVFFSSLVRSRQTECVRAFIVGEHEIHELTFLVAEIRQNIRQRTICFWYILTWKITICKVMCLDYLIRVSLLYNTVWSQIVSAGSLSIPSNSYSYIKLKIWQPRAVLNLILRLEIKTTDLFYLWI